MPPPPPPPPLGVDARLVPLFDPLSDLSLSAVDVVRLVYDWLVDQNWSTQRIADELNRMGVPTVTETASGGHAPAAL